MDEVKSLDEIKAILAHRGPILCKDYQGKYEYRNIESIAFKRDWRTRKLRQLCLLYDPKTNSAAEVEIANVFLKKDTTTTDETEAQKNLRNMLNYFYQLLEEMTFKASRSYYEKGVELTFEMLREITDLKNAFEICHQEKTESVGIK